MSQVESLIELLDHTLATCRANYYLHLRPGVPSNALDEFEERFCLKLPESFRQLYQWRNGQSADCFESLIDNLMFTSLCEVGETKEMLDGMIGRDFEDPNWWRRSWVPFLHNGGGDRLCVELGAEGVRTGQLVYFYHDWEHRPVQFPNLEAWLTHVVENMDRVDQD